MGKKNKRKKKFKDKSKKNTAINIDNKNEFKDKSSINETSDVWKKIILFSVLFLPYAIYLFLFKTKVSKFIKGAFVVIISILLFFIYDTVKYPNRVHNEVAFKNIQELNSTSELGLYSVYHMERKNEFTYKNIEYISFHIYDKYSMFYGIFEIKDYNKDYELVYLYDLPREEEKELDTNNFDEFKDINPVIFVEIIKNNILSSFDEILNKSNPAPEDIFKNNKYQTLLIGGKEIIFEYNPYGVVSFYSKDGSIEYVNENNPLLTSEFSSVYTVLSRNFKDNYDIVGFDYYNSTPVFNILVGDTKYIVRYYYGKGASLQSIDDEELYFNSLDEIYNALTHEIE